MNTRVKLELLAKFNRLAEHQDTQLQRLQISDGIRVKELYKVAIAKLRVKKGLERLGITENQLIAKVAGDALPTELMTEGQIEELSQRLDSLPARPKRNRRRKKTSASDANSTPPST